MAGDFNIFPWAASIGGLKRAAGLRLVHPIRPTLDLEGIPLLLDHVYAPGGGVASYRPLMGSDHKGVLADVWLVPR
jgi:endonuclease/exonuclease/phosphatase (EEP) superfamily protein YafD